MHELIEWYFRINLFLAGAAFMHARQMPRLYWYHAWVIAIIASLGGLPLFLVFAFMEIVRWTKCRA